MIVDTKLNNLIIGESTAIQNVRKLITKVANSSSNVLITGKSGTGKEIVARAIHQNSQRANLPFIPINCFSIPENLYDSELFGFKKGSFTGATNDMEGVFRAANRGTLFLDEIGFIPIQVQVKLLRAIETKEVKPIGSSSLYKIDIRVISTTNKNLKKEIEKGNFYAGLYYKLKTTEIHLPSLIERKEDIPFLVKYFIQKYSFNSKRKLLGIYNDAMKILIDYKWEGEVRELESVIEGAVALCDSDYITREYIFLSDQTEEKKTYPDKLKSAVHDFEKQHILSILKRTANDKIKCAETLGVGLSSLYRKIEELGIEV
ncbi:MAG: sigma-54-dependent Fis family transcriptional regulator [Candidatus Marinimicrobia bacterium]|nr:sigma-54-dependent Fis family transcriptional regulator [Candidatus Neomarinimicrobiota bacterium]